MKKIRLKFQLLLLLFVLSIFPHCKQPEITEDFLNNVAHSAEYKNFRIISDEVTATHISINFKARGLVNGVQQKGNSKVEFLDKSNTNEQELLADEAKAAALLSKTFPELEFATTEDFGKIRSIYKQTNVSNPVQQVLKVTEIKKD